MTARGAAAIAACFGVASAFLSRSAPAGDAPSAEALFREGRARWAAGDFEGACVKFAESERIDASPGTLLNLGACHERQAKLATAWAEFVAAADLATRRGDATQASEARSRAAGLAGRLPRLTIRVGVAEPGMSVVRDDVTLEAGSFGSPLPVDPGSHRIVASAPGYAPATLDVTLRESEAREVVVPDLVPAPAAAPIPPRSGAVHPARDVAPAPSKPRAPSHDAVLGWVIGGSGLALAATGGALFGLAVSANHNAQRGCLYQGQWACSDASLAAGKERDTLATFATVSGAIGVVGVGVGLFFLLRPQPSAAPGRPPTGLFHPTLVPEVSPRGSALILRETFE